MKTYTSYNDLPMMLSPAELSSMLGISRVNAYNLCHAKGFPSIRIGKRILVPKDKLLIWLEEQPCA